ncbi:alpha/beta hydrolase [Stagnimonas aquatica]|uniref:Alpha/beta hydrolase n=1 Tax=Stagnimonas aquatica TaxID=2689987 RepID=A0A3N0VGL5_9GAMM|nr:alpha/beta hydrolase [Stagnimonas aquatica]ROH91821.1 alpha/beta hydrolase [Stagnimonas aquatica]
MAALKPLLWLLLALLAAPAAPAAEPVSGTVAYSLQRDLTYTPRSWPQALKADVYLPETRGWRPAVLLIHGGGWAQGSGRKGMATIAKGLAERGYVVVNVEYRVLPYWQFPAPLEDLRAAYRMLVRRAADFRVDTNRIAAFGYSAGGHLAALLAATGAEAGVHLRAVVAGGAPADLSRYPKEPVVLSFLGGALDTMPERVVAASPALNIDAKDPPVFLYHGARDEVVPLADAQAYQHALVAAGVRSELYVVRGGDHSRSAMDLGAMLAVLEFLHRELRS